MVIAFVFGSVAKGTESSPSDVDLMVLGSASFKQVVNAVWHTQDRLNREVNAVVMTLAEFAVGVARARGFVTRVMAEPKHFVIGTSDDLEELVGNPTRLTEQSCNDWLSENRPELIPADEATVGR